MLFLVRFTSYNSISYAKSWQEERLWLNGLYDSAVVIFFPLVIFLAASGD
jgi:hypothetical protein